MKYFILFLIFFLISCSSPPETLYCGHCDPKDHKPKKRTELSYITIAWHGVKTSKVRKTHPDYHSTEIFEFAKNGDSYCYDDSKSDQKSFESDNNYVATDSSFLLFKLYDKSGNVLFQTKAENAKSRYNHVIFPYSQKATLIKVFLVNASTGKEEYLDEMKLLSSISQIKKERPFYVSCYRADYLQPL